MVEHVERASDRALLVEFSDEQGQAYAMLPLRPEQLLVLHRNTEAVWPPDRLASAFESACGVLVGRRPVSRHEPDVRRWYRLKI